MSARNAPQRLRTGSARERAADVLVRVESEGAFAAPALDAALVRAPALSPSDRGLATELVYGVLRTAPALDAALARHAARAGSLDKLDAYTRAVLRVGAYQLLALARVPPRAAVNEAVTVLKRDRSPGLAGFANALLRKVATERAEPLDEQARERLALVAVPAAVRTALAEGLGSDADAESVLRAMLGAPPPAAVRVNTARIDREALGARLAHELPDAVVERGSVSPLALRLRGGGDLTATPSHREGLFAIQEEGAQAIALASEARPGWRVLDACAGRGGKTAVLASMLAGQGVLHAAEMYPEKVSRIDAELDRLGLRAPGLAFASAAVDLTRGLGALTRLAPDDGYDCVLLDAPCSGLGTLGRRPDILARAGDRVLVHDAGTDEDGGHRIDARMPLPALQRALLDAVAPRVRVGGTLLYAVCTLTLAEGVTQIEAFRARFPGFAPCDAVTDACPERVRPSHVTLRPDRDGTDGYQCFRLRRER